VIVEGSKTLGVWKSLIDGYDSQLDPEWTDAWFNGAFYRNLYKSHTIDLTNTFDAGDTILIRFRLYSDEQNPGWGWTIDSLQIQGNLVSVDNSKPFQKTIYLEQNYPNPFNPSTIIKYSLNEGTKLKLSVFSLLGEELEVLVNKYQTMGIYQFKFDASNYSSGVYFYRLSTTTGVLTKKLLIIK